MKQLYKNTSELIQTDRRQAKRINIFLTKEQYAQLNKIKYQYRLSFSYIVSIIYMYYSVMPPILDKAKNEQLYKTTWKKSSIKPTQWKLIDTNFAKTMNNILIIYLDRLDKDLLNTKIYNKIRNDVANQFELTQDDWYDYNTSVRHYIAIKNKGL